jgi:hypothetical protein
VCAAVTAVPYLIGDDPRAEKLLFSTPVRR